MCNRACPTHRRPTDRTRPQQKRIQICRVTPHIVAKIEFRKIPVRPARIRQSQSYRCLYLPRHPIRRRLRPILAARRIVVVIDRHPARSFRLRVAAQIDLTFGRLLPKVLPLPHHRQFYRVRAALHPSPCRILIPQHLPIHQLAPIHCARSTGPILHIKIRRKHLLPLPHDPQNRLNPIFHRTDRRLRPLQHHRARLRHRLRHAPIRWRIRATENRRTIPAQRVVCCRPIRNP